MGRRIAHELARHVPFTAGGAITGVILMVIIVFGNIPDNISYGLYYTLHPLHVLLSALVTSAMYKRYSSGKLWAVILVGYVGSIGIATISDAFIPYLGASLLDVEIEFHVPFIEHWWINILALIGIMIGYWKQFTRLPHWGHMLISTWASLFYFTTYGISDWISILPYVFVFLFLAVLIPCCLSDIVFPLLFTRGKLIR